MTTVTNDGLLAVADVLGVQTLPTVLAVGRQQDSARMWAAAHEAARIDLVERGIVDRYGDVDQDLATALHTLANPDAELVVRRVDRTGVLRVCLARRGFEHALAVRRGAEIDVRTVWGDDNPTTLARLLAAALGRCAPADLGSVSAPARRLREAFDSPRGSDDIAAAVYALGRDSRESVEFAMAFAECRSYAEIIAYHRADGVTTPSAGSVGVYDTPRGRVIAVPSQGGDGELWTALAAGTDHRLAHGIRVLVESLPGGGWLS
jgi:hypothetical protein